MRRQRLVVIAVLVLAAALGAALPAVAVGRTPPYSTSGNQTLIYTASSGGQPQGAIIDGQYVRLVTEDCPMPARMLVDDPYPYTCLPPIKLLVLPGRACPVGR